jgi:hypothetical protein
LRYRAPSGEVSGRLSVNGRELGLGFPYTTAEWGEISVTRTFAAGTNTVSLREDWPDLKMDYLRFNFLGRGEVAPEVEIPTVYPRQNLRFTNELADLVSRQFKLTYVEHCDCKHMKCVGQRCEPITKNLRHRR